MKKQVIVDTGILVAILNKNDSYHAWAVQQFAEIEPPLLTCETVLYKGLGATDFIRFMQQFNQGYGNYTEDRQQWQKDYSVDNVLAEIKRN